MPSETHYQKWTSFVSWNTVLDEVAVPKTTLYDWINQGIFPRPIQLGPRRVAFCREELENWKAERIVTSQEGKSQ